MKTCKDCFHYEVCKVFNRNIPDGYSPIEFQCDGFADRSEWVHLPCKVGDTIYKLWYAPCHNGETYPDSCSCDGCEDVCDLLKEIFEFEVPSLSFIVNELIEKDNNSVYFLTREEAEKALERMKER